VIFGIVWLDIVRRNIYDMYAYVPHLHICADVRKMYNRG
jgi:hypothetical protein